MRNTSVLFYFSYIIYLIINTLFRKYENMRNEIEKSFLVERRTSAFKICLYGIFTVLLSPVIIALHKHAGQTK